MKIMNKLIAVLLVSAMTVGMTACAKSNPTVAPNASSSQNSQSSGINLSSTSSNLTSSTTNSGSSTTSGSLAATQTSSKSAGQDTSSTGKLTSGSTTTAKNGGSTGGSTTGGKSGNSKGAPPKSGGSTTTPTTGGGTYTPPKQPNSPNKPSPPPTNQTKPSAPKTAYDRPFNISQIRSNMIAYGKSKGMQLDTSLWVKSDFSTNCGYFPPMNTAQDVSNATQFAQGCRDDIDYTIDALQASEPNGKVSDIRFNIVLLPNSKSPGDYIIFVLYG